MSHTGPGDDLNAIDLREDGSALLVPLHVKPGARKSGVLGIHDGRLKIAVQAAPEKGKANQEVIRLLAKILGVSRSSIEIRTGATSPKKLAAVAGLTGEQFRIQLAAAMRDA